MNQIFLRECPEPDWGCWEAVYGEGGYKVSKSIFLSRGKNEDKSVYNRAGIYIKPL